MLILFETPAGFALFKVNQKKIEKIENVFDYLQDETNAQKTLQLFGFSKFKDTHDALLATSKLIQGKLPKKLEKFIQTSVISQDIQDVIAVQDKKLGKAITEKFGVKCVSTDLTEQLFRGIRLQLSNLVEGLTEADLKSMTLGLAHGLSRYKLKFSADKVDTMIIQAISLLDDLDKEINNYVMRLREWYGWHFPELGKVVQDNLIYTKLVNLVGMRHKFHAQDISGIVSEDVETDVKQAAEVSMGTEITVQDESYIISLSQQVLDLTDYRAQLSEYLKNRMQAIAPNLTTMVGELVGARLIAHAGSIVNLAKYPASTVQILGAEKALFKAIRTKHNTPKYGLIFQASLVGQAPTKLKGKISRTLAAKCALCIRFDALGEEENADFGVNAKNYILKRLSQLESGINFRDVEQPQRSKQTPRPVQKQYQETADVAPEGGDWMNRFKTADGKRKQAPAAPEEEVEVEVVKKVKKVKQQ